jgi:hypothetical protein
MKLSRSRIMLCCTLTLIGLLVGWSMIGADDKKQEQQPVQRGFTAEYVLIETQDGSHTVLTRPRLGILGDRTYLVGATISLDGVTNDGLFERTTQWVCLSDVRRLGEVIDHPDALRRLVQREIQKKARTREKPLLPPERVTRANFEKIEIGMSNSDVQRLLGPPQLRAVDLGMVRGDTYSVDFGGGSPPEKGFTKCIRQQWNSPEITIVVIFDTKDTVICRYTGHDKGVSVQ